MGGLLRFQQPQIIGRLGIIQEAHVRKTLHKKSDLASEIKGIGG